MAQALQLRRQGLPSERRRAPAPSCLRRARLLARLAPYIEKVATGAPGSRSPELLRLSNEDLVAAGGAAGRGARSSARSRRSPSGSLRGERSPRPAAGPAAATTRSIRSGLRDAADAPWALIGRGDPALLGELAEPAGVVTVVGARRASSYGREVARDARPRPGRRRASSSSAAWPSASTPAPTAARSRPAAPSPSSAAAPTSPTRPRTARSGGGSSERGLVLSELPPGTGAWRWTFPARNRIMAALAGMTVVVEAAERSGSLITAELAADLGRDLGAVPARSPRAPRPAPTTCSPTAPASSATPRTCSTRCSGPGRAGRGAVGPPLDPARGRGARGGRARRGHLRRGRRRPRRLRPPRRRPRSPPRGSGYVTCSLLGIYSPDRCVAAAGRRSSVCGRSS